MIIHDPPWSSSHSNLSYVTLVKRKYSKEQMTCGFNVEHIKFIVVALLVGSSVRRSRIFLGGDSKVYKVLALQREEPH